MSCICGQCDCADQEDQASEDSKDGFGPSLSAFLGRDHTMQDAPAFFPAEEDPETSIWDRAVEVALVDALRVYTDLTHHEDEALRVAAASTILLYDLATNVD